LALTKTIQTLVGQLWVVFLEDYNGKVHVVGSQNGTDVSSAVYSSDTQGYTLTISTKERELKYELTGAGLVDYAESLLPVL
jgi:choline kinase